MTTELFHKICEYLRELTANTPWSGHLYAVGGCCRDEMLHIPINDVDLAVDMPDGGIALADWLWCEGLLVEEPVTYPMFGTAMFRLKEFPDDEIEVVQTRREKYTPGRAGNPVTCFGSLKEDCFRRDLTVNSLYYDIRDKRFIDFTGRGIDDINNHVLRTPDDPEVTFDDDPIRILRCIRFASRLGWGIEPATYEALRNNVKNVTHVTRSRLRGELNKMLLSDDPVKALKLLRRTGALSNIFPEVSPTFRLKLTADGSRTAWNETLDNVKMSQPNLEDRWAAFLHNIGKYKVRNVKRNGQLVFNGYQAASARIARSILHRLRYDRDFVIRVERMIRTDRMADGKQPEVGTDGLNELQPEIRVPKRRDGGSMKTPNKRPGNRHRRRRSNRNKGNS